MRSPIHEERLAERGENLTVVDKVGSDVHILRQRRCINIHSEIVEVSNLLRSDRKKGREVRDASERLFEEGEETSSLTGSSR